MHERTRKSLLLALRIALGMLPRYLRHDLWRTAEPQHGRAVDKVAETLVDRIEEGFTVEPRPPKHGLSVADILHAPPGPTGQKL